MDAVLAEIKESIKGYSWDRFMARKKQHESATDDERNAQHALDALTKVTTVPPGDDTRQFRHTFLPTTITYTCLPQHPGAQQLPDGSYQGSVKLYHCPKCGQLRAPQQKLAGSPAMAEAYEEAGVCPATIEVQVAQDTGAELRALQERVNELQRVGRAAGGLLMALYAKAPWSTVLARAEVLSKLMDHQPEFLDAMGKTVEIPKESPF